VPLTDSLRFPAWLKLRNEFINRASAAFADILVSRRYPCRDGNLQSIGTRNLIANSGAPLVGVVKIVVDDVGQAIGHEVEVVFERARRVRPALRQRQLAP
jgi:hypothetical protein